MSKQHIKLSEIPEPGEDVLDMEGEAYFKIIADLLLGMDHLYQSHIANITEFCRIVRGLEFQVIRNRAAGHIDSLKLKREFNEAVHFLEQVSLRDYGASLDDLRRLGLNIPKKFVIQKNQR